MKKSVMFILAFIMIFATACSSNKMDDLPEGSLLDTAKAPDGKYAVETYLCIGKGEMYIRCAVVEAESSESRNIYWGKYNDSIDVEWIDNTNVKIEGKTINVTDVEAYYDYRQE